MNARSKALILLSVISVGAILGALVTMEFTLRGVCTTESANYVVVDTGQNKCYNDRFEISNPLPGQAFYGQDAQFSGNQPHYTLGADGLTVYDNVTELTWQRSPDTNHDGQIDYTDKLTWAQAQAYPSHLNSESFGGYSDWRLPTIKELYSLINFNGTDPNPDAPNTSGLTPFIDTNYFNFSYGFTNAGERIIDSQWVSSTLYVANTNQMFGVNFADGRIKGYPADPIIGKKYFVICVRGNLEYGNNLFADNGDGTITDNATGLMWTKSDSGTGMNWQEALAWVQTKNAENYMGHSDWRLPNAKELQSIVDYTRSPGSNGSAAIDPVFNCTSITNKAGQADYPFYWTGTTLAKPDGSGGEGVYIAFGRAMGYMNGSWQDVHGAGAQRSDPKSGNPANYPYGRGPQGDEVRIYNYVRLVRDAEYVDVVIADIAFSEQNPTVNETIVINVTVENRGNFTEIFDVSVNYTRIVDPLIGTQTTTLAPGESVTLNFTWIPTTSGRYEIRAYTSTISNDINQSDNTRTSYLYVTSNSMYSGSSEVSTLQHFRHVRDGRWVENEFEIL
jgi:hypothetical protein